MANPHVITLVDTAGDVTLASADDSVAEIILDGQSLAQATQGLRAETSEPILRRNRARTLTIRVKRKPVATPALALKHVFEHEKLLGERSGPSLTLVFTGSFTITFARATLTHRGSAPGVSSHHEYTITAGAYTVT
jgi:hypothetical protein